MLRRPVETAVASRRWATTSEFHRLNGEKRPGAVVRCGGTEGPLADQKAVVRHTYLIAPVLTLNRLRTLRGSPMLGSRDSGGLINAAYRLRELSYSDNSQSLTVDVVP